MLYGYNNFMTTLVSLKPFGNNIAIFFTSYFIGSYMKFYNTVPNLKLSFLIFVFSFASFYEGKSRYLYKYLSNIPFLGVYLYELNKDLLISCTLGICFFSIAMNIEVNNSFSKIISEMTNYSYGVFLFHFHPKIRILWNYQIKEDPLYLKGEPTLLYIITGIKFLLLGILLDFIRQKLFNVLLFKRNFYLKFIYKINNKLGSN
jgi:hypothetical protein